MTTSNTEPIPTTDAEIARWHEVAAEARNRQALEVPNRFIAMDIRLTGLLELLARIEQEREMRRELVKALSDEVSACSHLVEDPESCRRLICVISQRALARAAKMEADNVK